MSLLTSEQLEKFQKHTDRIRNICILAHVDHGKTTFADFLILSNGLISTSLAGKMRYMDSTEWEQIRGITMKSSSITLFHKWKDTSFLINLIDSPGHVDFSSEVSTATRLCDGALVLIDVCEGVQIQTHTVLKQAWQEQIKPCLVFNKMDRLILELQLTPMDAYTTISKILGQVNAIWSGFRTAKLMEQDDLNSNGTNVVEQEGNDDFFNPGKGNVAFSSALDGWSFRVGDFAKIYHKKLSLTEEELTPYMWGNYYYSAKQKKCLPRNEQKPLFVELILENLWAVYKTILQQDDTAKMASIIKKLNLDLKESLLKKDKKTVLSNVMNAWLPLSSSVLNMVCSEILPPNCQENRLTHLVDPSIKAEIIKCDPKSDLTYLFVSKMIPNEKDFVGFSRIFSGTITIGQTLQILGPKYLPSKPNKHRQEFVVEKLYNLMGKGCEPINSVSAGMIFGIGGISEFIQKTATISSSMETPIMHSMYFYSTPIVKFAVEPINITDLPVLMKALKLLNQADPTVEVYIQETGEHVIATAGEVHAERCFMDLKEWCGDVQLRISPPLLSFRETIIDSGKMVESRTANKLCLVKIRCTPIPFDVATQLNHDVPLDQIHLDRVWKEECKSLWAIGPKQHGSNLLINHSKMSPKLETFLSKYQKSIVSGFQLASSSGPLCAEPMMGVAFCIEEIDFHDDCDDDKVSFRGQLISAVKDACFESMSTCSKRIVEAIYKCDVHVPQTHVGKVYPVLAKRRAKITSEDFENGTDTWTICCFLPVAESFGFSSELRTKTSGGASPMLVFSHWQVLDIDPSWVPTTQEELEEFGEIGEQAPNLAKTYVDQVRRRKGLLVQEKLVEKGEKQRNLSKKK